MSTIDTAMTAAVTHLAFMYGTLKTTEANHKVLFSRDPAGVTFVGEGQTVDLYPLVVTTPFNIPFLLHKENAGKVSQTSPMERSLFQICIFCWFCFGFLLLLFFSFCFCFFFFFFCVSFTLVGWVEYWKTNKQNETKTGLKISSIILWLVD